VAFFEGSRTRRKLGCWVGSYSKTLLTDLLSTGRDVCSSQSLTLPFLMARFPALFLLHARCKAQCFLLCKILLAVIRCFVIMTGIRPPYPHSHIFGIAVQKRSWILHCPLGGTTMPLIVADDDLCLSPCIFPRGFEQEQESVNGACSLFSFRSMMGLHQPGQSVK
jgi:hypothetical protein